MSRPSWSLNGWLSWLVGRIDCEVSVPGPGNGWHNLWVKMKTNLVPQNMILLFMPVYVIQVEDTELNF